MNRESEHTLRTARHEVQEAISRLFAVDEVLATLLRFEEHPDPRSGLRALGRPDEAVGSGQ